MVFCCERDGQALFPKRTDGQGQPSESFILHTQRKELKFYGREKIWDSLVMKSSILNLPLGGV